MRSYDVKFVYLLRSMFLMCFEKRSSSWFFQITKKCLLNIHTCISFRYQCLHKTFSIIIDDDSSFPRILLALQNTCFPLSSFTSVICNEVIVFIRPPLWANIDPERLVMSTDDLYHVILAGGIQYDVIHDRYICVPATIVIVFTDMATYSTGTV